jgi:hypothetical protein
VARTVIRALVAFDEANRTIDLEPGAFIQDCRIQRNPEAAEDRDLEVYVMKFESAGRHLRCPLVDFQARTEAISPAGVEENPAREAAAVS